MFFFDEDVIETASQMMRPITEELTNRTRAALDRGETPDLLGALTREDLAKWISNARARAKGRKAKGRHR